MSQAAHFTINDGATTPAATLFTNVSAASGNLPATWYAKAKGIAAAHWPMIAVSSKGRQKARETVRTVRTPYVVTGTDGIARVVDSCFTTITTVIPDSVPPSVRADHQAYVANSSDTPLVKETETDGYAPN